VLKIETYNLIYPHTSSEYRIKEEHWDMFIILGKARAIEQGRE